MRLCLALLTLFCALAQANAKDIVVYTSRNEHLIKDIFEDYSKETGIKVRYRTGEPGALIQALKAEGANSEADIFLTVDAGNLWFAQSQNLFQPFNSEVLIKNIPEHLREKNNHWFGLSMRIRTIVYHTGKVKKSDLSSYEDLADPKWKGRLCLRTSKKVYNQSLVAMLIDQHGYDRAKQIVEGWVKNAVDIFANDTAVLNAINAGQCDVGIVNSYYYGRLVEEDKSLPLGIFWADQNKDGVHINISGAGLLRQSKNPEAAKKFLEWLGSAKAQNSFAQVNMEYPVLKGAPLSPLVKSWGEFKPNSKFELSKAGELQREAIKLMHEASYK